MSVAVVGFMSVAVVGFEACGARGRPSEVGGLGSRGDVDRVCQTLVAVDCSAQSTCGSSGHVVRRSAGRGRWGEGPCFARAEPHLARMRDRCVRFRARQPVVCPWSPGAADRARCPAEHGRSALLSRAVGAFRTDPAVPLRCYLRGRPGCRLAGPLWSHGGARPRAPWAPALGDRRRRSTQTLTRGLSPKEASATRRRHEWIRRKARVRSGPIRASKASARYGSIRQEAALTRVRQTVRDTSLSS